MRDYGIDLMDELDSMSWRRFLVLFSNLNPYGAVATKVDSILHNRDNSPGEENEEQDEAQANAFFSWLTTI